MTLVDDVPIVCGYIKAKGTQWARFCSLQYYDPYMNSGIGIRQLK